jgi:RNA polymerase sigma factor (TIGR02999 family)
MEESAAPQPAEFGADEMFAATYRELRKLARARLRAGGRNTLLDTTALVHETFVKVSANAAAHFPDRARFLAYASRAMRSVIVDFARQRLAGRRGGDAVHVPFTVQFADGGAAGELEIMRVHDALEALVRVDQRMARVVEMRYFGGLTEAEIAEALGVTDRTVRRDWDQARLFLAGVLKD